MVKTDLFNDKLHYLIIILILVIIVYLIYQHLNKNQNQQIENFGMFNKDSNNIDLTELGANPLIERGDSSKIILNPGNTIPTINNIKGSILLGTTGSGWLPFTNNFSKNSSLVINLNGFKRVTHIVTTGIKAFRAFYSKSENDAFSYEEILYKTKGSESDTPRLYFEICDEDFTNLTKFTNLVTADEKPIFASFIKIVPISFTAEKSFQSLCTTDGKRSGTVFQNGTATPGMKLEILGYNNDANPTTTGNSLTFSVINEIGEVLSYNRWTDKTQQKEPRLKIKFTEDGKDVAKQVNSIKFDSVGYKKHITEFSIIYKLKDSNISQTINNIKGNTSSEHKVSNIFQYYFETPIIASEIIIKPTKFGSERGTLGMRIVDVIGFNVNEKQTNVLAEKSRKSYCSAKTEDNKVGSVSELLNQQSEIQQLCDSLELQDQIKENNLRIQKNKQYLIELEEQDKKIAALEQIVEKMKYTREVREKNNDHKMTDQMNKQNKMEEQLKQLLEDRQKNLKQFNIKFKLNQDSLNKMSQLVSNVESANKPPTNEGFTNYTQPQQNQKQNPEYYNQGFYYRPYADETVKTQIIESSEEISPDLRLYQFNNQKFETVQPMKFYEDKILKCTTGCDTNTKLVKKMI